MNDSVPEQHVTQKWFDIWRLFDREEQVEACVCLFDSFRGDETQKWTKIRLVQRLAKATKFRTSEIERLFTADATKLAGLLIPRVNTVLDEFLWERAFIYFYMGKRCALMCMFLDTLQILHGENGGIEGEFDVPNPDAIAKGVAILERTYSTREIGRYLAVLARKDDAWQSVCAERDRLLELGSRRTLDAQSATILIRASDRFTVLDRTIIKEIVRTAGSFEGALRAEELIELVTTVTQLNEQWYRAYFHLGLADVLLPTRNVDFDRPEFNDARRSWYLAGVMAGLARSHAVEQLNHLLSERKEIFDRAAQNSGDAGAAIARTCFRFLIEADRVGDALKLLQNQVVVVGLSLGKDALTVATEYIREARYSLARQIVDVLRLHREEFEAEDEDDEGEVEKFKLDIDRRFGQCLQAQGDFVSAEKAFQSLQKAGDDRISPDLLADQGLVKGRFPSLAAVRLPETVEQRMTMKEALTKGEPLFLRAIGQFGTATPKACYSLAVLDYLRWGLMAEGEPKEVQRDKATMRAADAVAAIQVSDFEHVYQSIGALGQSQFMLAVLKYTSYDAVQGREAMTSWQAITDSAGRLPVQDLRNLVEAAEIHDSDGATAIAESIWRYRKEKAVEILGDGPWIARSAYLSREVLGMARSESTPRAERARLWCSVIPGLNRSNETALAEEGLDELEMLAQDTELTQKILDFISEPSNIDPAWKPNEAAWAQVNLLRRLQQDSDCVPVLRSLFFMVRDSNAWEVDQVLAAFEDWNLDRATHSELSALAPRRELASAPGIEKRLASGEKVRLLFVGGNEVQARNDSDVRREITTIWPGVEITFEHTGWSSNWGRELERLTRSANASDAVVLMPYMRTMLGRRLREALDRPWIPCTSTGKGGMGSSLRRAATIGLEKRLKREAEKAIR